MRTPEALGFSILNVVRDNPTVLVAQGVTHKHPEGVLFLTQFTQVAMAVLGAAQMAELREAGAFVEGSILAGHSVGEYNALAAVRASLRSKVSSRSCSSAVRSCTRSSRVTPKDAATTASPPSDPHRSVSSTSNVKEFVDGIAESTGEFLRSSTTTSATRSTRSPAPYAVSRSSRSRSTSAATAFGGKGAFILVPGIDVPFHSTVLRGGVPDFRARLDELLPPTIDPAILAGRYVPNLVPKPFSLDRAFIQEIADLVPSEPLDAVLADFTAWSKKPGELCRVVLIELLAWQFASPVRWIETQDLMFGQTWCRAIHRDRRGPGTNSRQPRVADAQAPGPPRRTRRGAQLRARQRRSVRHR